MSSQMMSYRGTLPFPCTPSKDCHCPQEKDQLLTMTTGPVPSPQPCPEANYMLLPQRSTRCPQPRPTPCPCIHFTLCSSLRRLLS